MDSFKKRQDLQQYFKTAYGFAVFDAIAKAGIGFGVAGGTGSVYKLVGGEPELLGSTNMMQGSIGWQFGAQVYSEIIFFETEQDFQKFASGNFEFGAEASAVALTASASVGLSTQGGSQGVRAGLSP